MPMLAGAKFAGRLKCYGNPVALSFWNITIYCYNNINMNEISRRTFLNRTRELLTGVVSTRVVKGLEFAAALTTISAIDVSFQSLIRKANAEERKSKIYIKPKEWTRLTLETANFSGEVFPKKLEFPPGKRTLVISAVWQTAALYDAEGNLVKVGGEELKFLASTGKVEHATELGVYKIQSKNPESYRSKKYKIKDAKGREVGAPMPFAKHIGKGIVNEDGQIEYKQTDGTAIHARSNVQDDTTTSFMSHGCIGLPYSVAEDFNNRLSIDDNVIVIGERMPTGVKSFKDMIKKLDGENLEYLEYLKKEVALKPQEIKEKKQCYIYCSATGQNIFDFMSDDPKLNPLRETNGKVRIPQSGPECVAVRKAFYEGAQKKCYN